MAIQDVQAIDVHGHYGLYNFGDDELVAQLMTGGPEVVVERARKANTRLTAVSPLLALFPRCNNDAAAGNEEAARVVPATEGLLQWVVVNPLQPATYDQADEMLQHPKCVGIKIHPVEHGYPITEHGREIFAFAAKHRAVVSTHSGEDKCLPDEFVPFADEFPEVRLILAHNGFSQDGDLSRQVRAIQASRHGNVFTDTSSSKSIMPGLHEWAAKEVGADHILYGTDTPLYFAPMQRARIDHADLSDADKRLILHDNAARLLGLEGDE